MAKQVINKNNKGVLKNASRNDNILTPIINDRSTTKTSVGGGGGRSVSDLRYHTTNNDQQADDPFKNIFTK